jgi:hypothetical protein
MTGQSKKLRLDKLVKTEYFVEQSVFIFNYENKALNKSQVIKLFIDFVQVGQSSFYERFRRVLTILPSFLPSPRRYSSGEFWPPE